MGGFQVVYCKIAPCAHLTFIFQVVLIYLYPLACGEPCRSQVICENFYRCQVYILQLLSDITKKKKTLTKNETTNSLRFRHNHFDDTLHQWRFVY